MNNLLDIFDAYVKNYDKNDPMIKLKYFHSYRVMDLCRQLSESLNLNNEDTYLAMIIGLLHDYARFEQWTKYKTYSDYKSVDHGNLAVKILFDNNEIEKFNIDKKYYSIIYNAIKYHNKYSYPENLDERSKLFCDLIKDADKIDIFYLYSIGDLNLIGDDNNISREIEKQFYENKLIKKEDIINSNEKVILQLAMIFDLNFDYSFNYLKENKIIESLFKRIKNKEKFENYFEYVKELIEKREKEYVRKKI